MRRSQNCAIQQEGIAERRERDCQIAPPSSGVLNVRGSVWSLKLRLWLSSESGAPPPPSHLSACAHFPSSHLLGSQPFRCSLECFESIPREEFAQWLTESLQRGVPKFSARRI